MEGGLGRPIRGFRLGLGKGSGSNHQENTL